MVPDDLSCVRGIFGARNTQFIANGVYNRIANDEKCHEQRWLAVSFTPQSNWIFESNPLFYTVEVDFKYRGALEITFKCNGNTVTVIIATHKDKNT